MEREHTDIDSILNGDLGDIQQTPQSKQKPKKLIREQRRKSSEGKQSITTTERSVAAKIYFENYFERIFTGKSQNASSSRNRRRIQIEQELDRMQLPDSEKTRIREDWLTREHHLTRISREKMSAENFDAIKPLGRGAYGSVQLVKEKSSGVIYAMKVLVKEHMLRENQESHVKAERDLLSEAASNDSCRWLVKLAYSFQDPDYLYFILEYLPGGDLLSLLIRQDTFPEPMAKFYAAEMVLCIEETHRLGYVHRDIKPDNFLIDGRGHLKLGDCGLATDFHWSHESKYYELVRKMAYKASKTEDIDDQSLLEEEHKELEEYIQATAEASKDFLEDTESDKSSNIQDKLAADALLNPPGSHKILTWRARSRMQHLHTKNYSVVGTSNYISPEVLSGKSYDFSCDWWSFAIIVFEMIYGYPIFASKSREGTRAKIQDWRKWLKFPSYVTKKDSSGFAFAGEVSKEAKDLIKRIICDHEDRLGSAHLIAKQNNEIGELPFATILNMMLLGKDAAEVKKHPWFKNIDFARITEQTPPWQPDLASQLDTKYFDDAVQDVGLVGPYAVPLGKTGATTSQPNMKISSVDAKEPELETIQSQGNSSAAENGGQELTQSLIDIRKRLAFVGFTFKGSSSVTNRVEAQKKSQQQQQQP